MIFKNGKKLTPAIGSAGLLKIMMNGSQIWPEVQKEIPLSETTAGDVLLWDKTGLRKLFVSSDSLSSYPSDSYTPIGIVVIPASHDVYGDGSCGVMSLREMSYDTPDEGSTSYQYIYWGQYGIDTSLPNLNQVPIGNTSNGIPTGQTSYAYLPSDKFSGTQCAHDTDAFYYSSSYIPSPYLTDGSRNPGYYQTTSPSSSNNALADFDGIGNSQILWDLATSQSDWKTASTITNNSGSGYSPAACCCWRYHTEATSQGDWYLPAFGELGYIMPPFTKINNAISQLRTAYGSSVGVELDTSYYYLSSTEYNSDIALVVGTKYGNASANLKYDYYYVRAFLKVSPPSELINFIAPTGVTIYGQQGSTINIKTSDLEKSGTLFQAIYSGEAPDSVEVSYTFNGEGPYTFTLSKKQSSNTLFLDEDVILKENFLISEGGTNFLSFTCGSINKESTFTIQLLPTGVYTPETAPNGVYIYRNNNLLYNPDNWATANNDSAIGVAVIDDNCKFAITKGEKPQRAWSNTLNGTDVSGLTNYTDSSQALTDFNGESNTLIIREAAPSEDASNNAAYYCYSQTVSISGRGAVHGYLPALGELQAAYDNKSAVDSAMSLIGGTAMPTSYALWSSTEDSSNNAWGLSWDYGSLYYYAKYFADHYAVPVFPLISSSPEGGV